MLLRRPRPSGERRAAGRRSSGRRPRGAVAAPARARRRAIAALVFSFAFALRAGVLIGPAVALILWRGVSPRLLILAAAGLLGIVVPALYLLFPAEDRGGYNNDFALENLGAHWVAVAAFALLVLALARTLSTATRRSDGRAAARAAADA